jgi:chorismate dehydratase
MTSPLRIGLFPFLNVQPLVEGLRTEPGIEVVLDLPSHIASRFRAGELDAAMVPSFEAATMGAPVLDSICIASTGAVETVMLHHRVPLRDVRSLALDEASRTSAALARILIAKRSGAMPACSSMSAREAVDADADALLLIGDPAFTFRREGYAALDLGAAWFAEHGLPFVFALMVLGPRGIEGGVGRALREGLSRGLENASRIAHSYNSGVDPARAERYLREVIHYDLGATEKEGLRLFYRLAQAHGLLGDLKELRFHAI